MSKSVEEAVLALASDEMRSALADAQKVRKEFDTTLSELRETMRELQAANIGALLQTEIKAVAQAINAQAVAELVRRVERRAYYQAALLLSLGVAVGASVAAALRP